MALTNMERAYVDLKALNEMLEGVDKFHFGDGINAQLKDLKLAVRVLKGVMENKRNDGEVKPQSSVELHVLVLKTKRLFFKMISEDFQAKYLKSKIRNFFSGKRQLKKELRDIIERFHFFTLESLGDKMQTNKSSLTDTKEAAATFLSKKLKKPSGYSSDSNEEEISSFLAKKLNKPSGYSLDSNTKEAAATFPSKKLEKPSGYSLDSNKKEEISSFLSKELNKPSGYGLDSNEEEISGFLSKKMAESVFDRDEVKKEDHRVYGRDKDKKDIMELLLSGAATDKDIDVITIEGKPGIGKTTIAQLVYNDDKVQRSFRLRAWARVTKHFYVTEVMRTILQEINRKPSAAEDLEELEDELKERLKGKRFLLFLDDVWFLNSNDAWDTLMSALSVGAHGSKIVVTTCNLPDGASQDVSHHHFLRPLEDEDCWNILADAAFSSRGHLGTTNPFLEVLGRNIAYRCRGLPTVAKTLGGLLHFLPEKPQRRKKVLDYLRHNDGSVVDLLRPSYSDLPPRLKRCFDYCSLFPQGCELKKEKIVLLWMAANIIDPIDFPTKDPKRRPEEVGHGYFNELISRNFFQQSAGGKSHLAMENLIHKLARSVAKGYCCTLEDDKIFRISNDVKHFSFISGKHDLYQIFDAISDAELLETFLPFYPPSEPADFDITDEQLNHLFSRFRHLRVLSLSHYHITQLPYSFSNLGNLHYLDLSHTAIKRLPDSVYKLHTLQTLVLSRCPTLTELPNRFMELHSLRHLDLSHTPIKSLPDSICELRNLQTLLLSECPFFTQFPTKFWKLRNLHHLDISGTPLKEMPPAMSELRSLQSLTNFVVGGSGGSTIKELGALSSLHGTLSISELQNVVLSGEASEASLTRKIYLDGLVLQWSKSAGDSQSDAVVLDQLRPHTNLKVLTIESYWGHLFPRWLGDSSFSNILFLCLSNCRYCSLLPPLGQLPRLKDLIIEGLNGIKTVASEFYGTSLIMQSSTRPFQSLKTLKFEEMPEWVEWTAPELARGELFPSLQELYIVRCPKLKSETPKKLSCFKTVEIQECPGLESTLNEQQADKGNKVQLSKYDRLFSQSSKHWPESPIFSDTEYDNSPKSHSYILQLPEGDKVQLRRNDTSTSRSSQHGIEIPATSGVEREGTSKSRNNEPLSLGDKVQLRSDDGIPPQPFEQRSKMSSMSTAECEDASKSPNYMAQIESKPEADAPINTSNGQDSSEDESASGTFIVSEISELMYLPSGLQSLKIESCDTQESLPDELLINGHDLRQLHFIDCHSLKSFPGGHLPTTLKMLYIRKCRKLKFFLPEDKMPLYAVLEHLCIGSSCDSLVLFPLASFPKLKSLSIWDCANFTSIAVPTEGTSSGFPSLEAIEIRDCPKMETLSEGGLPTHNLTSIFLSNCTNLKALPEQLHLLPSLQSLFINNCPELMSLPEGGLPFSLNLLSVTSCNKLVPQKDWGLHDLDHLKSFEIESECREMRSFPEEKMLPCNLNSLRIGKFLNLESLNYIGLRHLSRLETLEISCCNKLQSLPKEGLPSSLSSLSISECPLLTSRLQQKKGRDWFKIARIPHIQLDDEAFC